MKEVFRMNTKKISVRKIFDETAYPCTTELEYNKLFVEKTLDYCHNKLKARGYLFLNEVYQTLGLPETKQGQIGGWIYDEEHMKDTMWTVWTVKDDSPNVEITFEPLGNILDILPEQ